MSDDLKTTIVACVTVLLLVCAVIGGILINREIRAQDPTALTEFSKAVSVMRGLYHGGNK